MMFDNSPELSRYQFWHFFLMRFGIDSVPFGMPFLITFMFARDRSLNECSNAFFISFELKWLPKIDTPLPPPNHLACPFLDIFPYTAAFTAVRPTSARKYFSNSF